MSRRLTCIAQVPREVRWELLSGDVDEASDLGAANGVEEDRRGLGEHDVPVVGHWERRVAQDEANEERGVVNLVDIHTVSFYSLHPGSGAAPLTHCAPSTTPLPDTAIPSSSLQVLSHCET